MTDILWQHDLPPGAWLRFQADNADFYVSAHVEDSDPPPPAQDLPATVRASAWLSQHVPHNEAAALLKYARAQDLGAPLSPEYSIVHDQITYVVQPYALAILYVEQGQWHQIQTVPW